MAGDDRRRHSRPPQSSKPTRSRYAAEREERKEHGTPEKKHRSRRREDSAEVGDTPERTPQKRRRSPERANQKRTRSPERREKKRTGSPERTPQKRTRSPERTPEKRTRSPDRRPRREEVVVEYEDEEDLQGNSGSEESLPPPSERMPKKFTRRRSPERKSKARTVVEEKHWSGSSGSTLSSGNPLSLDALAKLDAINEKTGGHGAFQEREKIERVHSDKRTTREKVVTGRVEKEKPKHRRKSDGKSERRRISGPLLEEGRGPRRHRGGYVPADEMEDERRWFRKKKWLALGLLLLIILIVVVAVVVSKKNSKSGGGSAGSTGSGSDPSNSNLNGISQNDIPTSAKNTILDPFTWYDTTDLNVTYTNTTFGGLPIMGLNSTWNDTVQANQYVPSLDKPWAYGQMPIRGINLGGWLSIEPFITPSLFNKYKSNEGIIDEWTLTNKLGPSTAAKTIEKHYSQFITEADFAAIQAAGFDHVRIPYSYWAVTTYPGDPYVPKISWRYLLRGIEYARKYGLRVNLDLHGLPGSQNGWNHSGRQGTIGWLNGTDGQLNAQRSLDLHTQLSTFFAQPRYKNVITIYGLVNEPKMTELSISTVVAWTASATQIVRKSGMNQTVAFGDGFLGLTKWQGQLQGVEGLVLDAHEYTIFDANLIVLNHTAKASYACEGWTGQMKASLDTTTGFGPTLCGEWSQADTDCTTYLNDVGAGTRWEGTLHSTDRSPSVLTPSCPTKSSSCSCSDANADPSSYSDTYKKWLLTNAEAQMASFETAWGWFYWTWTTESATQWDWKAGMANGILPTKVWNRDFNCTSDLPSFAGLSENY